MNNETTVENLTEFLQDGATLHVRETLGGMHPAEIADLLEALPIPQRHVVWELTDARREGEVLVHASDEVRANLIEMTNDHDLVLATAGLDIDDLADLIHDLPDTVTDRALAGMDRQHRKRLERVLAYDENTAGGLMNTDVVTVRANVAMVANLLCAALAGVSIPIFLKKLGIDPALAGGVALTTVTDVIGIIAFLGLATLLLP